MTNIYLQCKQKLKKTNLEEKKLKKKIIQQKNIPYGSTIRMRSFEKKCHFCLQHYFKQHHQTNINNIQNNAIIHSEKQQQQRSSNTMHKK